MSRSTKKGPFVQPVLFKRVQEMNEKGEKRWITEQKEERL